MKTMKAAHQTGKTIAIIGGGVSGALTAYHLARHHIAARIVVIDPRPRLGLGLAYSTPSLRHLLNVPAGKISALPGEPSHFLNWLRSNYDPQATPETFAPRQIFGRYIAALVDQTAAIEHLEDTVVDYHSNASGATLHLGDGSDLHADIVVLATGNFDPATLPGISDEAIASGHYRHNAWLPDTFDDLAPDAPVVLIGSGLTGVDVLLRLRELGHRGMVTAISRHGGFPNRHASYTPIAQAAIPAGTPATCVAYLKAFHATLRSGADWRAAVDSLRATTNDLWLALSTAEQQRFRRHLQRRWEVVRHRMAPPIADVIEAELAAGTLVLRRGHLDRVDGRSAGAKVTMRTSKNEDGREVIDAARVINCTGPSMNYRRVDSPLLQSLFAQGLATAGPLGAGFNSTIDGALIGVNGLASETAFTLGPGRLGTLLESIAIPEIREQAVRVAVLIASHPAMLASPATLTVQPPANLAMQSAAVAW